MDKKELKALKEKLFYKKENAFDVATKKEAKAVSDYAEGYKVFLDNAKTEREAVKEAIKMLSKEGFVEYKLGDKIVKGGKYYLNNRDKSLFAFVAGKESVENGIRICAAHIDSPRLDLKQHPMFENEGFAYLKTHYYGGIRKYQWVTIPLALHGVIIKKDGSTIIVNIGEEEDDPVFFISDLLIHLSQEQLQLKAGEVIPGEALDIIVGNKPITIKKEEDEEKKEPVKEAVKKGVLDILKELYDVEEEDFLSAELEVVPAGKAREAGFDRSIILAYGQDDRVCAYTSMRAMLDVEATDRTLCCILVDKEEIGSVGATGMQSRFFENSLAELMNLTGEYSELNMRRCLSKSCMLSSDVSSAFDPSFAGCFDKKNVAYLGGGMVFNKFTGSRGKGGSNDANAEYLGHLRDIFAKESINFQTAELGRVDLGGGGTIAYILALYGMNVIDSGVAVMNMHAPWEATSKADVYETYRGYMAFVKNAKEI